MGTTMGTTTKAVATRAALLESAAAQLAERGWDATTSTSIASGAGVATGTFYTYFPDKQALLAALFDAALADLLERVDRMLTADRLLDDGLDATVDGVVGMVLDAYRENAQVIRTALGQVTTTPALRTVYWRRHAEAVAVVERFVRRGQAAGLVRPADPAVLAHALLLLTQGLNHPVLLTSSEQGLVEAVTRELVRLTMVLLGPED